jgi:hypothetical protein
MSRSVLIGALLLAIGVTVVSVIVTRPSAPEVELKEAASPRPQPARVDAEHVAGEHAYGTQSASELALRVQRLEMKLAEESAERRRLAERLDTVTAQLGEVSGGVAGNGTARAAVNASDAAPAARETDAPGSASDTPSAMERALTAAGLDPATAAAIKERRDALTMTQMYLRDQATREQWLDSPRFQEEMAALSAQEVSMRDEIGDDAYDRYLFALGDPNRVRVDDVLSYSPAAQAGLQTGDFILRYGDDRIFAPSELVAQTRAGGEGETVRLEIVRNGQRLAVEVPRGPLGLRVAAAQATPEAS